MLELNANLLKRIKYFSGYDDSELERIIRAKDNAVESFGPKYHIFRENDVGEHMYIILEGHVDVYLKGTYSRTESYIATLGEGDYFGENAALTKEVTRRTASVRTTMATTVFKIHKNYVSFEREPDKDIEFAGRFPAHEVRDMIGKIPLFKGLTQDEFHNVDEWTTVVNVKQSEYIYKHGDPAEYMYVVLEGAVELLRMGSSGNPYGIPGVYETGEYFGEDALMDPESEDKRHHNFARAKVDSRLIKIPKKIFELLMDRDKNLIDYMKKIEVVKKMKMIYESK